MIWLQAYLRQGQARSDYDVCDTRGASLYLSKNRLCLQCLTK